LYHSRFSTYFSTRSLGSENNSVAITKRKKKKGNTHGETYKQEEKKERDK